jgi:hypothetical protein
MKPRERQGRNRVGDHSIPDPDRHGVSSDQDRDFDEGHLQPRHDHQGHRLSVSLATPREQIDDNSDEGSRSAVNPNSLLEVEQSGSGADRQEDPRHYHHPHSGSSAIPRSTS